MERMMRRTALSGSRAGLSLPRMSTDLIRTMGRREHYPSPDQGLPLRIGYSAPTFGRRFLFGRGYPYRFSSGRENAG
jgi:hypothetical protein